MIEKFDDGCFRLRGRTLAAAEIETLLEEAKITPLRRARICAHYDINDALQEMFVLMMKDSRKGVYKYAKAGSAMLLYGEMKLDFLSASGVIMDSVHLSESIPFVKFEAGIWIRPETLSDWALLHEVHLGPWTKDYVIPWITKEQAAAMEAG